MTVPVLVTLVTAAGAAFKVIVCIKLSPAVIGSLFVAVTVPPAAAKLHPAPKPETQLRPAGSGSVTVIGPEVRWEESRVGKRGRVPGAACTNDAMSSLADGRCAATATAVRTARVA